MVKYLSVCSGIEAASVAWHGMFEPLAFCEFDAFPSAVLAHHYPKVPNKGDLTKWRDWGDDLLRETDLLVGGTPCQAFSVAGLRKSLDDDRGNLSLEYVRLADAIDDVRHAAGKPGAVILWENVPGVLSVSDNAFGCFIAALAGDVAPYVPPRGLKWTDAGVVDGPQRSIAWRILDAQYFGLAQRRRRVFVVASSRAGFDPAAVLLEWESLRRDTPPSREAREIAPTIPARSTAGGGLGTDFDIDGGMIRDHPVVMAHGQANAEIRSDGGTPALTCLHEAPIVAHTLKGEGFDASEDGTGRGTPLVPVLSNDPAHAICANEQRTYTNEGSMFQLRNVVGQPIAVPLQEVGKRTGVSTDDPRAGIGIGKDGDPMYTLQAGAQHGIAAYAFQPRIGRNGRGDMGDLVNTLSAESGETGKGDSAPCVVVSDTLSVGANQTTGIATEVVAHGVAVRRLTPIECERLQGFPEGYTAISWKGKPATLCPDGPRYKALGNSMAVPCMRWIGRRINLEISKSAEGPK